MANDDIQGTVLDEAGNPISGAVVALIPDEGDSGDNVLYTTTDANGNYLFDAHPQGDGTTQQWHIVAQYQDGGGEYNTLSRPNVSAALPEGGLIPDSGIARYEFEQDVTDSWNDNDGTDNSSAGYTSTAAVGSFAKSFDGDDYVTIPDLTGGLSAATATAYIKATDGSSVGNDRRVFGGTSNAFRLIHRSGGWEFLINSNGISQGSNTFSTGVFVFIAIVYDSTGLGDGSTAKIYKDDASEIASGNPTTATINTESKAIGAKTDGSDGWVGDIDDPRFYNKALSASEVSNLFNSGSI